MRRIGWALPGMVLVPLLSGCASLSAKSKAPDLPSMNVPPPPPRVIEPTPEPLPEPVSELPTAPSSSSAPRPRPPTPRPAAPAPDVKPDPKPQETPPASQDPAPVPQPPVQPNAQLRTPQTADTSSAEKNVRATLDRARALLGNIDYRLLTSERKKAYDDSQRFIKESEEKLKEGNFVFADAVAVKAERLAKELAGK